MSSTPKFWFKHDCFPESRDAVRNLVEQFGGRGYAIYNRLKELLYQQKNAEMPYSTDDRTWKRIGSWLGYTPEETKEVIDFMLSDELFLGQMFDDLRLKYDEKRGVFFSEVIRNDKENIMSVSQKRAEAGKKGAEKTNRKLREEKEKNQKKIKEFSKNGISRVKV